MLYDVFKQVVNGDDILIVQSVTSEEADRLCSENESYIKVPQQINGS